jgi:hypothetical protein
VPVYWNEAKVVQAFLAFTHRVRDPVSTPLIRHHGEQYLIAHHDGCVPVAEDRYPPSSLWLQRVR